MKRNIFSSIVIFLIIYFSESALKAEVTLPSIFSDNMVLQQQTDASIWGKASAKKNVKITTSWDNKCYSTFSGTDGDWEVKVRTPSAGGPFHITISDGLTLKISNILIGEVWVCSGQSNMDMKMKGKNNQPVKDSNKAIATSRNKYIRLFSVEQDINLIRLDDFKGQWLECVAENVAEFSATGYFFGRMIQESLGVPVGLICSSYGGTRIEAWMSENGLKKFDWINLSNEKEKDNVSKNTPTVLFNSMINPMVGYTIKGVVWYQGEANRKNPEHYEQLLPGLIENWRTEWNLGEFPFYYLQIAPYDYKEIGVNSAFLREAQLKASFTLPNVAMACLLDIGDKDCVHPSNKEEAGERLAFCALANTYNQKGIEYSGPILKEMKIEGNIVKLTFDHAKNGLSTFGKDLINFKLAGEDRKFFPAKAIITFDGLTLISPYVKQPVAVRYAFNDFVIGELYNTEGLPASSFRTDEWEAQ